MLKTFRSKRGLTLLQVIVALIVATAFVVLAGKYISQSNAKKVETEISSNVSMIESASKSYFSINTIYPVIKNKPLSGFTNGTPHKEFYNILKDTHNLSQNEIDNRVQLVDFTTLLNERYLSKGVDKQEYYILDKTTGRVYYIKEKASLKEIAKIAEQLLKDANDIIELTVKEGDKFDLRVDNATMTNVLVTVTNGKKVIMGGGNSNNSPDDIKLLVMEVESDQEGQTLKKLTNLTPSLNGGSINKPVTDLRILSNNTVLVHYEENGQLRYEVINY